MNRLRPRSFQSETLEARLPLTANIAAATVDLPDAVEGIEQTYQFSLTDEIATGGGSIGIDPTNTAFDANRIAGDFVASADLIINTSSTPIDVDLDPVVGSPIFTVPGLSVWAGDENGGVLPITLTPFDNDGAGPATEVAVLATSGGFELGSGFTAVAIGARPLAILAEGDITVDGVIDATPQLTGNSTGNDDLYLPGAGGGRGSVGARADGEAAPGAPAEAAGEWAIQFGQLRKGSGAGHNSQGEQGQTAAAPGGIAYGDLLTVGVLGGSGGGSGSVGGGRANQGGDGGGAVELGAVGDVSIGGSVLVDAGPSILFFGTVHAAGGGSGGSVLVHGDDVTLGSTAVVSANGSGHPSGAAGAGGRVLLAHAGTLTEEAGSVVRADFGDGVTPDPSANAILRESDGSAVIENFAYSIDWGDGSTTTGTVTPAATSGAFTENFSVPHTYADDGSFTIAVTVESTDAGSGNSTGTATASAAATVLNADPLVDVVSSPVAGSEGQTLTTSGSFTDVPADPLTFTASVGTVTGDGLGGWSWSYDALDDFAGTVTITADDGDGGLTDTTFDLAVANVDPMLAISTDSSVLFTESKQAGETVTLTGLYTDDGALDTHTATIDWGDGTIGSDLAVAGGSFAPTHVYDQAGFYDVTVTLTDDDTGATTEVTQTVIAGVALQDGVLVGIGTSGDDVFKVFRCGDHYAVLSRLDGGTYEWTTLEGPIDGIDLLLGPGDDIGFVSRRVSVGAFIDAGDGDDLLVGGRGDDILLGGGGYDLIFGQGGRDLQFGGSGGDVMFGDGGQDILVSGTSAYDADREALDMILAEWTSSRSYGERVDNVTGVTSGGLNGDNVLVGEGEGQTVFDDESTDWLLGGRGRDLYFAGEDDISFARFWETVEAIEAEAPTV